jgi:ABC-type transporter Mla subunit MlaD
MSRRIREVLVSVFVLGGIAAAIFAWFWFSGRIERGHRQRITVTFHGAAGLREGDPVQVLGIEKGKVLDLKLDGNRVQVTVALDRDVVLTEDARFAIRSVSYLGSDRYMLVTPGNGAAAGPTFPFEGFNESLDLEETFLKLDRLLAMMDPSSLTDELKQTKDELLKLVNAGLDTLNSSMNVLTAELGHMSRGLDSLSGMVNDSSTAGRLLSSPELYDEVRQTNSQVQSLIQDIKVHPERYIKVRLGLFR